MQVGAEIDCHLDCYTVHCLSEAVVTSIMKQRVRNLTVQKALDLTVKAFGIGGEEATQSASHQAKGQGAHLKMPS